jgi:hypothetical protein
MKRPTDLSFNTWDWQREIQRRCGAAGASFRFDPKATTAVTNGSVIIVPTPPEKATKRDYEILRAQVIHECGHLLRPEVFQIVKSRGLTGKHPLFMIFNQIEDRIQEFDACADLVGDAHMIDQLHAVSNEKFLDVGPTWTYETPEHRSLSMRMTVSLYTAMQSALDWMPKTAAAQPHVFDTIVKMFGHEGEALMRALEKEGWSDRIRAVRSQPPEVVYNLSAELYTRLFPELPPPPKPQTCESAGAAKRVVEKAEGDLPKHIQDGMATIPWELLLRSSHEGADGKEVGGCPSTIDWDGAPRDKMPPVWFKDVTVKKPAPSNMVRTVPAVPFALIGDVRRELQAKTKSKVSREKLFGRLDRRNLTRLVMPQVGDGTYNRSVFQQLKTGLKLDTAVTILVDCSGSMLGGKYAAAKEAALSLYDLCAVALRLPCEVLGFTHYGSSEVAIHTFKTYNEARLKREDLYQLMSGVDRELQGNSDGDALMVAYNRQAKVRSARKVIIVLSDGCPVEAGNRNGDATLRAAIAEIRSKGTELYGIGIMDENVRRYYSKNAPVVKSAADVPAALLEVLRDVLQRQLDAGP